MIDLRLEFRNIQRKWGHDIYLQRWNNTIFAEDLEKYTVRHMYPRTAGLTDVARVGAGGMIHDVDMLYYFQHDSNPKERDRIYEKDDRYPSGYQTYTLDFALPMRGRAGRVEYWVCGASRETPS